MKLFIAFFLVASISHGACVDERDLSGAQIQGLIQNFDVYIETENAKFVRASANNVLAVRKYHAQILPKSFRKSLKSADPIGRYNKRYLQYYTYPRMLEFLGEVRESFGQIGYQIQKVGESLAGRSLFYVGPKKLDPNKKTIVMFGRHHGDEGTANWIIEGFVKRYLSESRFNEEYQLVLYPMINPDGAMAQTRYNLNNRDLNRSWTSESGEDEIVSIHAHLGPKLKTLKDVVIALDMHGSFEEDFVYRVDRRFKGDEFYEMQQRFIDTLGVYDSWQAGNFILSNGHPGMARIVLINNYNLHALTHETIKNIPLKNSDGRSVDSLLEQGEAIVSAISELY